MFLLCNLFIENGLVLICLHEFSYVGFEFLNFGADACLWNSRVYFYRRRQLLLLRKK